MKLATVVQRSREKIIIPVVEGAKVYPAYALRMIDDFEIEYVKFVVNAIKSHLAKLT